MAGIRLSSGKRTLFSPVVWSWAPEFSVIFSQKSLFLLWFWFVLLGFSEGRETVFGFFLESNSMHGVHCLCASTETSVRCPCCALTSHLNTSENSEPKMPGELPASNDQKLNYNPRAPALPARGKPLPPNATDFHLFWGSELLRQQKARAGVPKYKKKKKILITQQDIVHPFVFFFLFTTRALLIT